MRRSGEFTPCLKLARSRSRAAPDWPEFIHSGPLPYTYQASCGAFGTASAIWIPPKLEEKGKGVAA